VPISRRFTLLALAVAIGALMLPVAAGGSVYDQKSAIDSKISSLQARIQEAKDKESRLTGEISSAGSKIASLQSKVSVLTAKVDALQHDLDRHRARLAALAAKYHRQTVVLARLTRQHQIALARLNARLVQLYESQNTDELAILLQASSLNDLLEQVDYFNAIGERDKQIVLTLARLKVQMHRARERTATTKKQVAAATAALAKRTAEVQSVRDRLVAEQTALAALRSSRKAQLATVKSARQQAEEDLSAEEAASAALAAQIQAAQVSSSSTSGGTSSGSGGTSSGSGVSSSGLIWPVSGPVTSPFGYRCLAGVCRLHSGIDIGVPIGTPVHAAAAGRVIFAGVMDGYGNIVVIDHGNGMATAYAHLSAIYAGGGTVSQGQVIAASGCTGHCFGPHLHFEVRINGNPVDPMGYLP
jgi:septal ring factor EnvC (AmiA/AmiB activator)